MTTIVSIHQPNNDLFHMFDNIYVLAKGGVCVYYGLPIGLRQHLIECNINCNENQIPIEVLLKICSEDKNNNQNIEQMINKSKSHFKEIICEQNMETITGTQNTSKRLSGKDFYTLLKRTMTYTYRCQWKSLLIQFLTFQLMALIMKSHFNPLMIIPDGCIELDFDSGCNQTLDEIRDENFIKDNIKYHLLLLTSMSIIIIIVMSVTFTTDYKIFFNEHQNGMKSIVKNSKYIKL